MRLLEYLASVKIDSQPEPRFFWSCAENWQREIARALAPALEAVAGIKPDYAGPRSFWLTRTRGSDKTSAVARFCTWLLVFAQRPVTAVVAASTRDQANELKTAIVRERSLNAWMGDALRVVRSEVRGPAGTLQVVSADAAAQYGRRPELIICDELTNWDNRDLWDALLSAQPKRNAVLVVMCNAGFRDSWQAAAFEQARGSARWWIHNPTGEGAIAGWISPEQVAEQRRLLPMEVFRRLWLNEWVNERGDYLTWAEIIACRDEQVTERHEGVHGVRYVVGLDYAEKLDNTVGVVIHAEGGRIVVDAMKVWVPRDGGHVEIPAVEAWVRDVNVRFHRPVVVIDPWQLIGVEHRLRGTARVERWKKTQHDLASNLRTIIVNQQIAWPPGCGAAEDGSDLENEIARLVVKQTEHGWKFDHQSGQHDDRAVALGIACLSCQNRPAMRTPELLIAP